MWFHPKTLCGRILPTKPHPISTQMNHHFPLFYRYDWLREEEKGEKKRSTFFGVVQSNLKRCSFTQIHLDVMSLSILELFTDSLSLLIKRSSNFFFTEETEFKFSFELCHGFNVWSNGYHPRSGLSIPPISICLKLIHLCTRLLSLIPPRYVHTHWVHETCGKMYTLKIEIRLKVSNSPWNWRSNPLCHQLLLECRQ